MAQHILIKDRDGDMVKVITRDPKDSVADPIISCESKDGRSQSVYIPDWFADTLIELFREID